MNEALTLWARYNLATDEKMQSLLAGLTTEVYTAERPGYFKTLAALHVHYVQTYRFYQALIRKNTEGKYLVSPLTEEAYELKATTAAEVGEVAVALDKEWLKFVQSVTEADLRAPKTKRTMRNGKSYLLSVGDLVTQYQNHTVHHRGQLSQQLDELGVEHDIGGLLVFAEETE
ncbi:MAG: DinB family protein [Spirochaetales bacterium]